MFEKGLLATGLSKFSWPEVRRQRFLLQPAGLPKLECRVWIRWQRFTVNKKAQMAISA